MGKIVKIMWHAYDGISASSQEQIEGIKANNQLNFVLGTIGG